MKIQLDTNSKIIKIEESVNLGQLEETLERILPNDEWKKYKLEPCIQNFSNLITPQYNTCHNGLSLILGSSSGTSNEGGVYKLSLK